MDEGLRSYMLGVYNYMAASIVLTGIVAYFMFSMLTTTDPTLAAAQLRNGVMLTEAGRSVYGSPLMWVIVLAPLAFVFFLSFRVYSMSVGATQIAFWAFAAVMGASLSTIFLRYTGLTGQLTDDCTLMNPQNLTRLTISGNNITGSLPKCYLQV